MVDEPELTDEFWTFEQAFEFCKKTYPDTFADMTFEEFERFLEEGFRTGKLTPIWRH